MTYMSDDPARALIRTHLANERTFLAWLRSGLAAMALGVAAAQLLDDHTWNGISLSRMLSVVLAVFGGLLVLIGRWRYRQTAGGIRTGEYRPHRRVLEVAVIGSIVVMAIALVIIMR